MLSLLKKARFYIGYILFIVVLIYALMKAPDNIWQLKWGWVTLSLLFVLLMFAIEMCQFYLFLFINKTKIDFWQSWKMNSRKAVLNIIFPAKPGTVYAAAVISQKYQIGWGEYLRFLLYGTAFMIGLSLIAAISLFLTTALSFLLFTGVAMFSLLVGKISNNRYLTKSFPFAFLSISIYGCRLAIFWGLLVALGQTVTFYQASCFAISINILAQISITPGNMGVREVFLGLLAPFLSLDLSAGVFAGVVFQLLRLLVCSVIMVVTESHPLSSA